MECYELGKFDYVEEEAIDEVFEFEEKEKKNPFFEEFDELLA